jgi:hypothetical protein
MADYSNVKKEETFKSLVKDDFFKQFGYEPNIDNIDFVITAQSTRGADLFNDGAGASVHYLWAEAKKGTCDIYDMYTQLILTCKKTYTDGVYLAPSWLGCFDQTRISFVPFNAVLPVFSLADFNWNTVPSDHTSADFKKARSAVEKLIGAHLIIFHFGGDENDIKQFIQQNFIIGANAAIKSPITEANFVQIFYKWVKKVRPTINMTNEEWAEYKKADVLECDFFRADVMSDNGNSITISEKLKIILENDKYKLKDKTKFDRLIYADIGFTDEGSAYRKFWNRYERPPAEIYHKYIIDRRDLLMPENIRERKGTFFTPKIWADKSKEYLEAVFGKNWQEEYYIWDCAAGSGNLLAGLTNPYNVFASDIDQANVETMKAMSAIDKNLTLLDSHIFQFDFLNDILTKEDFNARADFCAQFGLPAPERKMPQTLCDIIDAPEKRKKLIVYINPPYAEASSTTAAMGTGHSKAGVSITNKMLHKYQPSIGKATNEISALFMARIYNELSGCRLALFSKMKFVCTQNFIKFRFFFMATYKSGFVVRGNTFDNVNGQFPIAFTIWDLDGKSFPKYIDTDVPETGGKKRFWDDLNKSINNWIKQFNIQSPDALGLMIMDAPDFQKIHQPIITLIKGSRHAVFYSFTERNLTIGCIYLSVRLCIEPTWLNDRDQFLYPDDGYKTDTEFQNNCLVFTLFHGQNRISIADGINHWIPFTEAEVGAKDKFQSNFMSAFLKGREFSTEAAAVLDAGRELWKYYHLKIKTIKSASVNASFYDIRDYFQGRNEKGKMNNTSADEQYNQLIAVLREAKKTLAVKIAPKVYEYGFLKE